MRMCSFFSFIFFSINTIMHAPFPVETSNEQTCVKIERDEQTRRNRACFKIEPDSCYRSDVAAASFAPIDLWAFRMVHRVTY